MNLAVFAVTLAASPDVADPSTVLILIVMLWGANGFLQAMGWPSMVRVMTHWFPVETRGKAVGLLGTCYQFGGAFSWFLADHRGRRTDRLLHLRPAHPDGRPCGTRLR